MLTDVVELRAAGPAYSRGSFPTLGQHPPELCSWLRDRCHGAVVSGSSPTTGQRPAASPGTAPSHVAPAPPFNFCCTACLQVEARAPAGDPVKNARALLRNALPIENKDIREIQVKPGLVSVQCSSRQIPACCQGSQPAPAVLATYLADLP